jgi:hypothetical protein
LAQEEKAEEIGLPYQEVSQADVNIMAEYYAAQEIAEGKPVRLCHFDGELYVVTVSTGSDAENWSEVEAWPVLPLASFVGDVRTYQDAQADYYAGDISDPDHVFSYERIKINCGSKKKPNWYVINGPKTVLKVNYSAEYPDDEIEALAIEQALHSALHCVQGAAERWRPLQENGATDAELTAAIGKEFGLGGGSSQHGGYRYKGGKSPQFSWPGYADLSRAQTLKGKRLLAKVREIMEIGAPGQVQNATADDDDFTAPRCSECGRIDGAHTSECSQNPNTLAFEDYLAYAEFTKPKAPRSWARKWLLSREMDGPAHAWKLYWKELEDSGVIPFLELCMCGHPPIKHKPEVGCEGKLGDQDCQCVTFVASAKAEAEEPKRAEKGSAAW